MFLLPAAAQHQRFGKVLLERRRVLLPNGQNMVEVFELHVFMDHELSQRRCARCDVVRSHYIVPARVNMGVHAFFLDELQDVLAECWLEEDNAQLVGLDQVCELGWSPDVR